MLETVISLELPVGEKLVIERNRLQPQTLTGREGRISVVTGIHGDELEGQYVCYELIRRLNEQPEHLKGIVDIYPALNPLAIDILNRAIPKMDMDMNRIFPGDANGNLMERVAAAVVDGIIGSDVCVDAHASDTFVREIPQVRVSEDFAQKLLPFAKLLNMDMVWMNATATVHEATLAHSLNVLGVPALVVEMGLGNRINSTYGNQLVDGIFYLMKEMGLWDGEVKEIHYPVISTDGEVEFIRAEEAGVFLPNIAHNHYVQAGGLIGRIVKPKTGTVRQEIRAGRDGLIFTLREYPMVYKGALLARILTEIKKGEQ